ncbi:hypothetical protein ACEPPN_014149 [Leptodophora sp. 'Broadleaf-Isolate-01']
MFDDRHDIASQLVVKWARFGPKERINVPDDFTRNIARIAASCPDEIVRASISALAGKDFEQEILNKRRSPLDILNTPAR